MLAASALSGFSYASTSISESVDLDLVEQIIERAPRSATSFPLVYKAYGEVLEEHGISPASDTSYYQFLLKLGVTRASTWGERWDLWKATHTAPSSDAVSPKLSTSQRSKAAAVRARVPFLASASSDLDEGFAEGGTYDGDAESLMAAIRPSPRKIMRADRSRSLVGYTPSTSMEYDAITLDPPFRTSTPVYAQEGGYQHERSMPPLPPYSVSDISENLNRTQQGMMTMLDTPKAKSLWWNNQEESMEDAVDEEMEMKADIFYSTGLLGRCWDVWTQANDWVLRTTEQIDNVRDNILLRQTLTKWRARIQLQLEMPDTADQHHRLHLQAHVLAKWTARLQTKRRADKEQAFAERWERRHVKAAWSSWRMTTIQRKTKRWQKDMIDRERVLRKGKEEQTLRSHLKYWADLTRDRVDTRIADTRINTKLLRGTFTQWRALTERKEQSAFTLQQFQQKRDNRYLTRAYGVWQGQAILLRLESLATQSHERRLTRRIWDQWRVCRWQQAASEGFLEQKLLSHALTRWRGSVRSHRTKEGKAVLFVRRQGTMLLKSALDSWITRERGELLLHVQEQRRTRRVFSRWHSKKREVAALDTIADTFVDKTLSRRNRTALSRWRSLVADHQRQALQADLLFEAKRTNLTFVNWRSAVQKIRTDEVAADKARAFFASRQTMQVWKVALLRRRQQQFVDRKRVAELRQLFVAWSSFLAEAMAERKNVESVHAKHDQRIVARTLSRWTERVIELKSRELDVADRRDSVILRDAFARWSRSARRVKDCKGLMQSVIDVRTEDYLRNILITWRSAANASQERRVQAHQAEKKKESHLIMRTFGRWRARYRERELRPIEEDLASRHEDAVLYAVWDKWKARSTLSRAVGFTNQRLRRLAWSRWRTALDRAREEKEAVAPRDHRLLADAMTTWLEAYKRKLASQAIRQRGRLRRVSGTSRLPPPSSGPLENASHPHRRIVSHLPSVPAVPTHRPATRIRTPTSRAIAIELPEQEVDVAESLHSEPAYTRLRSELVRRRGGSEELPDGDGRMAGMDAEQGRSAQSRSEVLRALRGTLPGR